MSVEVELHESAAVVRLRWPEQRNALGPDDVGPVGDALEEAVGAGRAAVILTGEGAFCAGGDLRGFAQLSETRSVDEIRTVVYSRVQRIVRLLATSPAPTIAAVDGPAIGLGMDLALACDMRFVGPNGWLRQGWARAGLIPGTGGAELLHRLNPAAVWPLLATQRRLDSHACTQLGLAEHAERDALSAARQRADELAAIPDEVRAAYVALIRPLSTGSDEHLQQCATYQAGFIGSQRFRDLSRQVLGRQPAS